MGHQTLGLTAAFAAGAAGVVQQFEGGLSGLFWCFVGVDGTIVLSLWHER